VAQTGSALDVIAGLGLPAVERGVMEDPSRVPHSPEGAWRRADVVGDRVGADGVHYVPGKVIVKFREGTPRATRLTATSVASRGGQLSEPLSNADFDLIRIDPAEDPAAVAETFAARSDVEYAQPDHRFHTQFVPNDPLYRQLQWNLPLIDLERA